MMMVVVKKGGDDGMIMMVMMDGGDKSEDCNHNGDVDENSGENDAWPSG